MLKGVEKFGLAYSDFPTMLSNIAFFLRTLSLNVDPRNQTRIPTLFTVLDIAFSASYCYVYLVSMIWFVFWRSAETGDVLTALIIFSLGTASQIGPWKIVFMLYHSYALVEPGSRFFTNLTKSLKNTKRRAILFWCVIMGNGFLYILEPIVLPGRHLMEDLFIILGLEPMFETPNYQIAFILMAMGICVAVYFASNATVFQIVISGYIEAQMLAWGEELTHIWEDAEKHNRTQSKNTNNNIGKFDRERNIVINGFVNQRLKDIIKAHATNLSLLYETEGIFRGALAVEFSLLIVSLVAELVAGLQNTYMEVPFALFLVGMDCFTGQKVSDASVVFERAVYHCKWENFNKDNMKSVKMVLMTAQKTMTLSAGGMNTLNFVSLLAIIKMIYSAYTTLSASMN